ncbi:hypothetical protein PSD17_07330 [Pseudonocardia sp. D17]|nr:hypothetical protein PSD17_07330 [Pseudonocardia sp. D17]
MSRRRARHRLHRSTRAEIRLRPNDRPHDRGAGRRGPVAVVRALLAGTVGLLLLTGTAVGLAHASQNDAPVPAAFVQDR